MSIKCSEMDNINITYEYFSFIKIVGEELIKYIKSYKQISMEHMRRLSSLDNNMNFKSFNPEDNIRYSQIIKLTKKLKEVIAQNIELINCSIQNIDTYIVDFEKILKEKADIVNELKKSSLDLSNNLKSSYQEVNRTGNIYITSLSKTEDIIDKYYIKKIKIKDHENGLGDKLNNNEYNNIKEQQKNQTNEMNNSINLSKKYEDFHKGAIIASNKLHDEFIDDCNKYKNKIKENICKITEKIKEVILYFFVSFRSVYNQPLNLIENYINELNNLDESKEIDNSIEQNLVFNNSLRKVTPVKYELKSFKLLKNIKYIKKNSFDINLNNEDEIINIEDSINTSVSNRKAVKALDDDNNKLYYICDDALMLTIKTIFDNYDLIDKENFNLKLEESKNKTQRYVMKIIENMNLYSLSKEENNNNNIINENLINNNIGDKRNEFSDEELMNIIDLLNEHDNRIIFLQKLSDYRVRGQYNLLDKDYIYLSKIFESLCNYIKKYSDYHTAELLIILSQTYYTINKKGRKYIQMSIKENELFKGIQFWEEYLCYSINKEIMKMLNVEQNIQEDKEMTDYKYANIVFTQILNLIDIMFEFNLSIKTIREVLEPKITVYRLNDEFKATINEVIQGKIDNTNQNNENNNEIKNKSE